MDTAVPSKEPTTTNNFTITEQFVTFSPAILLQNVLSSENSSN